MKANFIAPKTVTTIIISYGFLQLDEQTLHLINHEIRKVNKRLKSLPVQPIDLGLQISDINCRGNRHYAKYLETNLLDFIVLMPMPQTKYFQQSDNNDKKVASCAQSAHSIDVVVAPLVHSYESIDIDFEQNVYVYNKSITDKHNSLYLNALTLIRAADKIRKEDVEIIDTEQVPKLENLVNWLYQRTYFSKSHFGAVISWKDIKLMGSKNFAATILENFNHIMINISNHDDFETENHLEAIVQDIARYSLLVKKKESVGNNIPTEIQISFLVTIDSNDFEVNRRQADRVILAAQKANEISPKSVQTVFFDWLACSRSEVCSWSNQTDLEIVCLHVERLRNLTNILTYTFAYIFKISEAKNGDETLLTPGSVEDKWFEELQLEYKKKQCVGTSSFYRVRSPVLCKTILRQEDIAKYGGLKAYKIVIESFSFCTYSQETRVSWYTDIYFYLNVVDCIGGHSNMSLLVEYTTLMENLSKWAVADDIFLFVNAGVEPSKCNENWRSSENISCGCGWWIKQESDDTYQNKKSVAQRLYEKAKADEEKINTHVSTESLLWLWVLIPIIISGVLFTIPATFLVFHYHSKYILTKREVDEFIKGRQTTRAEPVGEGDEAAETQSYNCEKYELTPSDFKIDTKSSSLGSGEFGRVFRGSIKRDGKEIETAVKVRNTNLVGKSHGYYLALKGLLTEIKILAYVGEHNHIVSLLGAYTKKVRKGEIAVFLELCQLGSLDKYLHTIKPLIIDGHILTQMGTSDSDGCSLDEEEHETGKVQMLDEESRDELFRWAGEIADGMEFLASKNLVHADLATRNVLLTSDKVAKICDFGLSRRLYDYTEYVKQNQAPLPWRWMAPESLCRSIYNEKTDVWAYGITLWEMFTLGDQPYPGLSWTSNFLGLLERGLRLPEPRFNSNEIYSVMLRCWDISPSMRPSFTQLKFELNPN